MGEVGQDSQMLLPNILDANVRGDKSLNLSNLVGCGFDILISIDKARPQINSCRIVDNGGMTDIAAPWRIMSVSSTARTIPQRTLNGPHLHDVAIIWSHAHI